MKIKVVLVIVLLIILMPVNAFADFGPKPTLQVLIKNSEDQACFITFACDYDAENPDPDRMYEYTNGDIRAYLYKDPSYITTIKCKDYFDMKIDTFGYYNVNGWGIPYAFNLVLQYESGEVVVSDLGTNDKFNGMVLYDVESGSVENITMLDKEFYMLYYQTILYMLLCVAITLVVEILISLLFKIRPFKVLILTNIATQILLHTAILTTYRFLSYFIIIALFIYEIIIWVIEYIVYKKFAKSLSGKSIGRYVFIANLVSMILSFPSIVNM